MPFPTESPFRIDQVMEAPCANGVVIQPFSCLSAIGMSVDRESSNPSFGGLALMLLMVCDNMCFSLWGAGERATSPKLNHFLDPVVLQSSSALRELFAG